MPSNRTIAVDIVYPLTYINQASILERKYTRMFLIWQ